MNKKEFVLECKKLGINLSERQIVQFEKYFYLLNEWNQKINLTAITDEKEVYLKHFYDSLTMVKVIDLAKEECICDVGSGAGFPGIVLKIAFPHLKLTIVDALNKRLLFLDELIKQLDLKDVSLVHARAEEYAIKHREEFDIVTARAVASFPILLELCIPMVKKNKYFIAYKSNEDLKEISSTLEKLCSKIDSTLQFKLPNTFDERLLVKIIKTEETPIRYPRRFDKIKKNPL